MEMNVKIVFKKVFFIIGLSNCSITNISFFRKNIFDELAHLQNLRI